MSTFPSLRYRDARVAIDWLERALGFEAVAVHDGPDGTVGHAELRHGDGLVMLGSEPADGDARFGAHAGTGWTYVAVDPDAVEGHLASATEAGAEVVQPLSDTDYGSRDFSVRDPEGNLWSFGTYRPGG